METEPCGGRPWGFIATDVSDPAACITACREKLLARVGGQRETLEAVCEAFSDIDHMIGRRRLRELYCCDAQRCGVDNIERAGHDPNINWLITSCQNIGYYEVEDPGPPPKDHTCLHFSHAQNTICQAGLSMATSTPMMEALTVAGEAQKTRSTTASYETAIRSVNHPTTLATSSRVVRHPSSTGYTRIVDPSLRATANTSQNVSDSHSTQGLSTGLKVTIVLVTIVGALLVATLIVCAKRSQTRLWVRKHAPRWRHRGLPSTPTESPQPLVSPSLGPKVSEEYQLTPPARLSERRLLPHRHSPSSDSAFLSRLERLPLAKPPKPLPASSQPPTALHSPRFGYDVVDERIGRARGTALNVSDPRVLPLATESGSIDSIASSQRTAVATISPHATLSHAVRKHNSSLSKYHHSQRIPPDIPGLASPGPPPSKALPSPPLSAGGAMSPSTEASSRSMRSSDATETAGGGVATRHQSHEPPLSPETRDLFDLTERFASEPHNSWGRWGGIGGGGPGVAVGSPRSKVAHAPVLEEADLENLGGKY